MLFRDQPMKDLEEGNAMTKEEAIAILGSLEMESFGTKKRGSV